MAKRGFAARKEMIFGAAQKRRAFEREALPHMDALYAMALRLTRDPADAEDLVQDGMVKAYRFFHRYNEGTNIRAWLFKVMVNLFYNDRRKAKKEQKLRLEVSAMDPDDRFISQASGGSGDPEANLLDQISEGQLRDALEKLPENFRIPVVLCDLYDFNYREIADILGCPIGTVMSRLYRGRQQLKRRLYQLAVEQGYIKPETGAGGDATDLAAYRRSKGKGAKGS